MEFNVKLQELRKQKNLTQEELAEHIHVSRAAVSKWESGRGYPSIDSLKEIAKFYSLTIDELLSSNEILTIAEEDYKQRETHYRDLVYGLLDCSVATFFFLPFFGQQTEGIIQEVNLLSLTEISPCLKIAYYAVIIGIVLCGILTLALQNFQKAFWIHNKLKNSFVLHVIGTIVFIISRQPYAAALLFAFLIIKTFLLIKKY